MKVSEITVMEIREYLRLEEEEPLLDTLKASAKGFIRAYTGLTEEQMDEHEDLAIALLVLCADMYDNRQMAVQNDKVNPVIERVLAAHSVNLL